MTQGILPYKYEEEKESGGMTAFAGLPPYLDLAYVMGLGRSIEDHMKIRSGDQGYTDAEIVMALILLNLAGGESVSDIRILEGDDGLCRILDRMRVQGKTRRERRALERRWRKERRRAFPSPTVLLRYLAEFHDPEQEQLRVPGTSFIPKPNERLRTLRKLIASFVARVYNRDPKPEATLDMDATLVETNKAGALYSYKKSKSYQPLNTYWFEIDQMLHSEFRDGNVPAGFEQERVFREALDLLPAGVKKVFLRSDTAAYQHDLMSYCAQAKNERFGVIEFAIGAMMSQPFKHEIGQIEQADWHRLYRKIDSELVDTGQEYAEICYVPCELTKSKDGPSYRYVAIREPLSQPDLPEMDLQQSFPFPTMDFGPAQYKVFGIVTNRDIPADELIWWYRQRCGKSEEVHAVMKEDMAGGRLPSGKFGANAAWWQMMILALNLNSAMKHVVLGGNWVSKRLKAIRYWLINLPGRVAKGSRGLIIRLTGGHPSYETLIAAREKMESLYDTS